MLESVIVRNVSSEAIQTKSLKEISVIKDSIFWIATPLAGLAMTDIYKSYKGTLLTRVLLIE